MLDFYELQREHEAAKFRFVLMELEVAITFAQTALNSDSDEKAARNVANSKRAYGAAIKFLQQSAITPEMSKLVGDRIQRLSILLGEKLPPAPQNRY